MKGKTHDLNHDLTFSAHTINCKCHSIRSMFRVLGMYNFGQNFNGKRDSNEIEPQQNTLSSYKIES